MAAYKRCAIMVAIQSLEQIAAKLADLVYILGQREKE